MKYRIFLTHTALLFIVFLMGACVIGRGAREKALEEWLSTARRPVKVTKHNNYQHVNASRGNHYYTLIDSTGRIYLAKGVRFELPEVIK